MKNIFVFLFVFSVLSACTEKVGNCKKDQKRIKTAKKSGNLKNW